MNASQDRWFQCYELSLVFHFCHCYQWSAKFGTSHSVMSLYESNQTLLPIIISCPGSSRIEVYKFGLCSKLSIHHRWLINSHGNTKGIQTFCRYFGSVHERWHCTRSLVHKMCLRAPCQNTIERVLLVWNATSAIPTGWCVECSGCHATICSVFYFCWRQKNHQYVINCFVDIISGFYK